MSILFILAQEENIYSIYNTIWVSNLDTSIDVKDLHWSNILLISVTLLVIKLSKFNEDIFEHL